MSLDETSAITDHARSMATAAESTDMRARDTFGVADHFYLLCRITTAMRHMAGTLEKQVLLLGDAYDTPDLPHNDYQADARSRAVDYAGLATRMEELTNRMRRRIHDDHEPDASLPVLRQANALARTARDLEERIADRSGGTLSAAEHHAVLEDAIALLLHTERTLKTVKDGLLVSLTESNAAVDAEMKRIRAMLYGRLEQVTKRCLPLRRHLARLLADIKTLDTSRAHIRS